MKMFYKHILVLLFSLLTYSTYSQLHHQSISVISNNYVGSEVLVFQSIGQLGPIGNFNTNKHKVFQGFQQPLLLRKLESNNLESSVITFPNPFDDKINFLFKKYKTNDISVSVYDLNGKLVKEFIQDVNFDLLSLNLADLEESTYVVTLKGINFFFSTKVIKQ